MGKLVFACVAGAALSGSAGVYFTTPGNGSFMLFINTAEPQSSGTMGGILAMPGHPDDEIDVDCRKGS